MEEHWSRYRREKIPTTTCHFNARLQDYFEKHLTSMNKNLHKSNPPMVGVSWEIVFVEWIGSENDGAYIMIQLKKAQGT